MKILLISDKPVHYRVDFYNRLTDKFSDRIHFYFINNPANAEREKISVFSNEPFLKHSVIFDKGPFVLRNIRMIAAIMKVRPDVIINVSMSLRLLFLIAYVRILGKKLIVWWGGTEDSEKNVSRVKRIYRKVTSNYIDGMIFYSKLAERYFESLNKRVKNGLVLGNNTFDSARYFKEVEKLRLRQHEKKDRMTILSAGYLIERKNIHLLLEAYGNLKKSIDYIELVIVGDGPEKESLIRYCVNNGIDDVDFRGFISHDNMASEYARARIFVQPSLLDRWPQTYNEAASSGLPILISRSSGVLDEYTEENEEYVLFNPRDKEKLQYLLKALIEDKPLRERLGEKALETALKNDCRTAVENLSNYLDSFT